MKKIEVVCGFIETNDRYLIGRRKPEKSFGNLWEFPGGKIRNGETPEQALKREITIEEFPGMEINIMGFMGKSPPYWDGRALIHLWGFSVKYISGIFNFEEHSEIAWVLPHEFDEYEFCPPDIYFKRMLQGK